MHYRLSAFTWQDTYSKPKDKIVYGQGQAFQLIPLHYASQLVLLNLKFIVQTLHSHFHEQLAGRPGVARDIKCCLWLILLGKFPDLFYISQKPQKIFKIF